MISLGKYSSSITKLKGSSRTTIPSQIANILEFKHKGKLDWELMIDPKTGEKYAIMKVK